jgi:hypothetical protein
MQQPLANNELSEWQEGESLDRKSHERSRRHRSIKYSRALKARNAPNLLGIFEIITIKRSPHVGARKKEEKRAKTVAGSTGVIEIMIHLGHLPLGE